MTETQHLAGLVATHAQRTPHRIAIRHDDVKWSYEELDRAAGCTAHLLRASGVRPGDRVALMLPNVEQFVSWYQGILRAGGVVVSLDPRLGHREIVDFLMDAGATTLIAWHESAQRARLAAEETDVKLFLVDRGGHEELLACVEPIETIPRPPGATAAVLYTSGTTGPPKGAQLTHRNLTTNARACAALCGLDGSSVALGALPLWRSFGQTCVLNASLAAGGCVTLLPCFEATDALEIIERDRASLFAGVPAMFAALLEHPSRDRFDTSALRVCVTGGSSVAPDRLRSFENAFGCVVYEGYGLVETSPVTTFNRRHRTRKGGSVGLPIDGVEVRVVADAHRRLAPGDIGEIHVRGENVMKGYWRRPALTAASIDGEGWLRTGDLARVDEDGYIYVVARKSAAPWPAPLASDWQLR